LLDLGDHTDNEIAMLANAYRLARPWHMPSDWMTANQRTLVEGGSLVDGAGERAEEDHDEQADSPARRPRLSSTEARASVERGVAGDPGRASTIPHRCPSSRDLAASTDRFRHPP
jgi:hypothetical protein